MSSPWDSPQESWPKRTANPFSNWSGDSQSVIGGNGDDIFDYQGEPVDERPNYNFSAQVAVNNSAADDIFGAGSVLQTTPYSNYSEPAHSVSSAASAVVVPEDDGSLFSEIEEAKAAPSPVIPDDSNSGAHYATVDIDDEDKVEHSHAEEKAEAEIKQEQLPLDNANFFEIEVPRTEIMNGGDYVAYHVHTKTMLNLYKNNEMNVKRRYSDFVWLQEQLLNNHKGIIIPPLPDKAIMQTSKLIGSSRLNDAFTEYRRKELDRFLKRVASHPTLCTSKYLQIFLETEDSSILKATKADPEEKAGQSSSGGWGSFFGKVVGGNSATEIDPYFEDKQAYIRELTKQMDLMAKMASNLIAKHIEMVSTYTQFSDAARALSKLETTSNNTLARSYNHLADISVQSHQLEQELSENAAVAFSDNIKDYVRLLQNVQKVLDTRLEKLAAFQAATKDLDQKRQKSNAKPAEIKLKTAVDQAEKVLEESKEVFDSISQLVKSELERFEATKAQEMHYAIFEFAQLNMNHEIRVLDLWKNFINEQ